MANFNRLINFQAFFEQMPIVICLPKDRNMLYFSVIAVVNLQLRKSQNSRKVKNGRTELSSQVKAKDRQIRV